jgi:predicted RND superfamily exporter protein
VNTKRIKQLEHGLAHYFESVPDQVSRKKWFVWLFVIAATVFAIMGMGRTKFDMTIEAWFADDDPTIAAMDEFRARFGSDDHLYIVYKPRDGDVFSTKSLETARALRRDLLDRMLAAKEGSPLKHIVKITTLANAPVLKVQDDALVSSTLVGATVPTSRQGLAEIRKTAESQRSLALQYFSRDHRYGGILVETNFGAIPRDDETRPAQGSSAAAKASAGNSAADDPNMAFDGKSEHTRVHFEPTDLAQYLDFINDIKASLNKPEFAGHFEYHAVGNPAATEYNMQSLQEMGVLYTAMLAIMIGVLWFVFRSLSGVLWPSLIVILSAVWTIGFTSWLGVPFTAFLILTVAMILVIGISDSIHILSGYEYFRNKGQDHRSAMRSAFRSSANACFLTAVTSMVGILSVVFTPIVPIQVEAITTAAGIGFAFLLTIYLLPLMVELWWRPRKTAQAPQGRRRRMLAFVGNRVPKMAPLVQAGLQRVFPFVQKFKYPIAGVALVALAICLYGMSQLRVDTNPKGMFPKDAKIRGDMDIADRNMLGSQTLKVYFDLGAENALHDPFVLERMDELQKTLESKYGKYVVRTLSLVDVVKRSYQVLNEDRPQMYAVPQTRAAAANTFFMFDNSNTTERRKMVSDDYSKGHINVYLRTAGSYEYTRVFDLMQKDIDAATADLKQKYPQAQASVTGLFTLMMQGSDYLSWNALSSFGWAIVTISVILLLIFGSLKAGVISVAANAVPVTLTFGLMGLLGVPLDFTTVLIAPIVIGLAVDDTVHFLVHYRHEVSIDGDVHRALVDTIKEAGQAVTYTSLVLALGLSVVALSSSPGNANVGIYGALAVLVGWVCELLLTPALILIFGLRFEKRAQSPRQLLLSPNRSAKEAS